MKGGLLLSMDLSASVGSLALLSAADVVLAREVWVEPPRGSADFWRNLAGMVRRMKEDGTAWSTVAVGRGPGRYTGLRTSMMCARALALADARIRVQAVDSGAALALSVFRYAPRVPRVVVAGDARRGKCWIRSFRNARGWPAADQPWRVCDPHEVTLPRGGIGVSPEWSRLEGRVGDGPTGWICEDRAPDAVDVGLLARRKTDRDPPEPVQPLYLHPAVSDPKGGA